MKSSLLMVAALGLSGAAGAAGTEIRLGVQGSVLPARAASAGVDATGLGGLAGVHVSVQGPVGSRGVLLRGTLEGNLGLRSARSNMLLDLTLLRVGGTVGTGKLYYGAGLGSGVSFDISDTSASLPAFIFSPIRLANVHGVVGWNAGDVSVEALARLSVTPAFGVKLSLPVGIFGR
ncbi:hypothetical protein [Deinococcus marmoris]|uniref:hypothetical protein n=1 Tax=Deinococcus marmoris TaxID=249408 RepID=UPI0012DC94AE|nr:hypothetical protein [Deinococcus marmoris]